MYNDQKGLDVCYCLRGCRPDPRLGPILGPSRTQPGSEGVPSRFAMCFGVSDPSRCRGGGHPVLVPSVPSSIGPGQAETDFLATSEMMVLFLLIIFLRNFQPPRQRCIKIPPMGPRNLMAALVLGRGSSRLSKIFLSAVMVYRIWVSAKGDRQKEISKRSSMFFFLLGHFWSLFLTILFFFCQTPFARLLLRQGENYLQTRAHSPKPLFYKTALFVWSRCQNLKGNRVYDRSSYILDSENRERELNTNYFFSNFSGTSRISRQNPGISRQKSLISLVSRDISNFSAPTLSRGRPPPHRRISGPKSLGLGSFFFLKKQCFMYPKEHKFIWPKVGSEALRLFRKSYFSSTEPVRGERQTGKGFHGSLFLIIPTKGWRPG